jgi:excisionase family DNA binding protein
MSASGSSDSRSPAPGARTLLTAADLAARWQVSEGHVYNLTRRGILPVVRLGRYYRYRLDAIEQWELAGGVDEERQ